MNYEQIKQLGRETGQKVTDLIALAPQNDPFYTGTPGDWALAQWFADLWHAFGYGAGVHIRRVHYQIISQKPPVQLPNGKPYENTEECWGTLNMASKAARYLRLVDPGAFDDRRNPGVQVHARHEQCDPRVRVYGNLYASAFSFPDFPDLPEYATRGYEPEQAYHLEVWCEKSTMNDVLGPLCQHYGANLQTGLGELSITATLALVHRLERANKPARIFYVSDFDPAGQSMPVAVSRKIEYFIRTLQLPLDVRVFPVVLTLDQIHTYQLPRTPIKETERRRVGFEGRYGEGAVELDALEALYPGELQRILEQYIESYYDVTLPGRVKEAEAALQERLQRIWQQVTSRFDEDIAALQQEHVYLKAEFEGRMADYRERTSVVWQAIMGELDRSLPSSNQFPVPDVLLAREIGEGLYNSERDYLDQIDAYRLFQGKAS